MSQNTEFNQQKAMPRWATLGRGNRLFPSQNQPSVGIIRAAYDAFARRDIPAVLAAFDPQIHWQVPDIYPAGVSSSYPRMSSSGTGRRRQSSFNSVVSRKETTRQAYFSPAT